MKKIVTTLLLAAASLQCSAQLADGSTAPNFSFVDTKGKMQDLYTYLNEGKYVVVDMSATWCGPCWYLHNTLKSLENQYTAHDVVGDNTSRVLFIEGDAATTLAQLQGGSGSQGDWLTGTDYPVMNPASTPLAGETSLSSFKSGYGISFYPTLFVICPNKKVWQDTLNNSNAPWATKATFEWINANKCSAPAGIDVWEDSKPVTLYPNPANNEVSVYFGLNKSTSITASIVNVMGQTQSTINFGTLYAGDQKLTIPTATLPEGIYTVVFTLENGKSVSKKLTVTH